MSQLLSLFVPFVAMVSFFPNQAHAGGYTFKNGRLDVNVSAQQYGGDAGRIELHLSYADAAKTQINVAGQTEVGSRVTPISAVIPVAALKSITLEAEGGNGADGYDGRNGMDGSSGFSGSNGFSGSDGCPPTSGSNGSSGSNGTNGTDGTSGSDGGDGGDGGTIAVDVPADQTELMLFVSADASAGQGGSGGRGGRGGQGGRGGDGGRGGQGGRNTCVDSNGLPTGGPNGSDGYDGSRGSDGSDGRNGYDGSDGRNGSTGVKKYVTVDSSGAEHEYSSPLRLKVGPIKMLDDNEDGILEPGEKLHLVSIKLANSSDMPTPAGQTLRLQLQNSKTLAPISTTEISIQDAIPPKGSITRTFDKGAIVFQGADQLDLIGGDATIVSQLLVNSVGISSPLDSGFDFSWPLSTSSAADNQQFYFSEAKSVGFTIKNVSKKPIGPQGEQPMTAEFVWTSKTVPGKDVTMTLKDGRKFTLGAPVQVADLTVGASSSLAVPISLTIKNSASALNGSGSLKLNLYLNDLSTGKQAKVDSSTTSLEIAMDLRPQAFDHAIDVSKSKITCHFPKIFLAKDYTLETIFLSKKAGSSAMTVQFTKKQVFGNGKSPVYQPEVLGYVPYSRQMAAAQPTAATVVAFMNGFVAPLTRSANNSTVLESCKVGK